MLNRMVFVKIVVLCSHADFGSEVALTDTGLEVTGEKCHGIAA